MSIKGEGAAKGGVPPKETATRFADVAPQSYDKKARTVEAVISLGSAVKRWYGTEKLLIRVSAVDLNRMETSGIPLLDSHNQHGIDNHLGRFSRTWFTRNALMGEIVFNDTPRGRQAEGMVARGEIKGISAGYTVQEWEITDKDGRILDPDKDAIRFDDDLTFTAKRWELLEASLVSVPADAPAMIRTFGSGEDQPLPVIGSRRFIARNGSVTISASGDVIFEGQLDATTEAVAVEGGAEKHNEEARARMQARQRMIDRMRE